MATLRLMLPDPIKITAEDQAVAAGLSTVDGYIAKLMETAAFEPLDLEFEGEIIADLDSGESVPLTRKLLNEIRENVRASRARS